MDALSLKPLNKSARFDMRLGIVTQVKHWESINGQLLAYEPYVREIRIWADLFAQVEIYAPAAEGPVEGNLAPYDRTNIVWRRMTYNGAEGSKARLIRLSQLPRLAIGIKELIQANDLVQLRGPSHAALIGTLVVGLMRRQAITKYAGLFDHFEGERATARFERWLLRRPSNHHCALVYGPTSQSHLISFRPALMDSLELTKAAQLSSNKSIQPPFQLLAVGRLTAVKGFDLALLGLSELRRQRPDLVWEFTLVGDGPEAKALRELANESCIADQVQFTGALSFAEVQKFYARSHIVIMPGVQEGWPKTIAEAWAHCAIPVAADAGLVPWILRQDTGVLFRPHPEGLAEVMAQLLDNPNRMRSMARTIPQRAKDLSLDNFKTELEKVLIEFFNLSRC